MLMMVLVMAAVTLELEWGPVRVLELGLRLE